MCNAHYTRERRMGLIQNLPEAPECAEPGCERRPRKSDRCYEHNRIRKPKPLPPEPCEFSGCTNRKYRDRHLCYWHVTQFDRGVPLREVQSQGSKPRSKDRCIVPSCDSVPAQDGLCATHSPVEPKHGRDACPIRDCERTKANYKILCEYHNSSATKFNLSKETYRDMVNGGCDICGRFFRMAIDHDHDCCSKAAQSCGNCIRGALCGNCNNMLGHAKTAETLRLGAEYLERTMRP
jgi:hypothetical protein